MLYAAAADYHTYGVWCKDNQTIWFYHNGRKVAEVKPSGAFNESMYMFLDTEAFTWAGLPTIASLKDHSKNTIVHDLHARCSCGLQPQCGAWMAAGRRRDITYLR
ncbi:MAG: glycosyl hydrolase family protein [Chloroflexi bacterium AL-N10]|nr:glycosyl hydrolase family protein [Chloroflexi bacterium AL-N1]NOK65356.1 glycosyl hydrolase family protein [Chloroflexi bacterium AL-N10]NOK72378.1 glycosyl hydrolase family protein [Chloroflexi bacterium AL-N5]